MRTVVLVLSILMLIPYCVACTGTCGTGSSGEEAKEGPEGTQEGGATPVTYETLIPGTTSSTILPADDMGFERCAQAFLKGIITDDRELIEANITDEMTDKIEAAIDELGFREFAEDGDLGALWEKLEPVSTLAFTAVSAEEMIAVWIVSGKDAGLKDLTAQISLVKVDEEWKVSGCELLAH